MPNVAALCLATRIQGYLGQEKGLNGASGQLPQSSGNARATRPPHFTALGREVSSVISRWPQGTGRKPPRHDRVLATRLSAIGLNIERIATQNKDVEFTFVDLELQVSSRTHLARVMKRLTSVDGVLKVVRSSASLTDCY